MFEKVFKNIDDILYKDPGADSELDYVAQTSWVLFLSCCNCIIFKNCNYGKI